MIFGFFMFIQRNIGKTDITLILVRKIYYIIKNSGENVLEYNQTHEKNNKFSMRNNHYFFNSKKLKYKNKIMK